MSNEKLIAVARAIHLAKVKECSFAGHDGYTGHDARLAREPWPEDRAEFNRLLHAGQSWIDLAMAQAKEALKVADAFESADPAADLPRHMRRVM